MEENEKRWVKVYTFYEVFEQQSIESLLRENGIPLQCLSREDSAYDGALKSSIGLGIIKVPEEFIEKTKKIISSFEKEKQATDKEAYEETRKMREEYIKESLVKYRKIYFSINLIGVLIFLAITVFSILNIFAAENLSQRILTIVLSILFGSLTILGIYFSIKELKKNKK